MAKFQDKHLKLRDNQRTYFGDSDDCSMWFDSTQLRVSCTLSGVDPTQDYHLTTKYYVDNLEFLDLVDTPSTYSGFGDYLVKVTNGEDGLEFTSLSGINDLMDHGQLLGLGDDDHLQYVRADGGVGDSRGFTATVSGVYPTQDYHLVTKEYVDDQVALQHETGRTALALNDSSKAVTFATAFPDTNYSVTCVMNNTTDANPSIYPLIVTAKATTGFTALFSGDIDSNNYFLEWTAVADD
jgi:hypothetical protein